MHRLPEIEQYSPVYDFWARLQRSGQSSLPQCRCTVAGDFDEPMLTAAVYVVAEFAHLRGCLEICRSWWLMLFKFKGEIEILASESPSPEDDHERNAELGSGVV